MATEPSPHNSHVFNVTESSSSNDNPLQISSSTSLPSKYEENDYRSVSSQGRNSTSQRSLPHSSGSIPSSLQRPVTPIVQSENTQVIPNSVPSTPGSSAVSGSPTCGAKRTVSGVLKLAPSGRPNGSAFAYDVGHSRNLSSDSSSSRVGELAAQLKTRLSYAMVKVQNGWESRSINEVEHLASQMTSPSSTVEITNTSRAIFQSPRAAIASSQRRSRDLSAITNQDFPAIFPPWGQTPEVQTLSRMETTVPPGLQRSVPTLAPAPEISTSRGRRSIPNATYSPPTLHTPKTYGPKTSSNQYASPHTPTVARGIFREPSEKAEQDAIDTLLFMSSPANSDAYPRLHSVNGNHTTHSSPLRTDLPRSTLFGEHGSDSGMMKGFRRFDGQGTVETRAVKRRSLGIATSKVDVESMLDAMAEGEESSDDEVILERGPGIVGVRT